MNRLKYILTWVALAVMIIDGLILVISSWNSRFNIDLSSVLIIWLWVLLITASIYLFFFAVKRTMVGYLTEREKSLVDSDDRAESTISGTKTTSDSSSVDINMKVRKMLRGIDNLKDASESGKILLQNLAKELEIMSGIVYFRKKNGEYFSEANYAVLIPGEPFTFKEGEGLSGQTAKNMQLAIFSNLPDEYLEISSGLGSSKSGYLALIPIVHNNRTEILIEVTGFRYEIKELGRMFQLLGKELAEIIAKNSSK